MRYSIITPSLVREGLVTLCQSLDAQVETDWEHLIGVNAPTDKVEEKLLARVKHPQRRVLSFDDRFRGHWGNPIRQELWKYAQGDYILYTDDDCYYLHPWVFEVLNQVTEPWAIFQGIYRNHVTSIDPIKAGRTEGNFIMFRRSNEIGTYVHLEDHACDGLFIESLLAKWPPQRLEQPLVWYGEGHS